jgi:DNA-binding MarR family transcriptional regulator
VALKKSEPGWADLTSLDRLIHEPARLTIMVILSVAESADFLYLERETGLTRGNLSAHLTKLEEAGYVKIEKTFHNKTPRTLCRLTPAGREAFQAYLSRIKGVLDGLDP